MKTVRRISILFLCVVILITINTVQVEAKSKVKLNKTKVTLMVGKTSALKLVGSKVKKWSTSDKKIATVSSKGKVTAIKTGSVTIKAIATDGKSYKCTVTVKKKPNATYSDSEVMDIMESTLREAGFVKTTEYMTPEELEEFGPSDGCGWGDVEVNMSNPQDYANEIVSFMNTCGYKLYYLENLGSTNGIMTIRVYNG